MNLSKITWPQVALAAIVVPSGCALVYGLVLRGETFGGIAAAVGAVLAALGWSASRTNNKLDKVEKLANGNLSRESAARAEAERRAIEQLHAIYQQALRIAADAPPGTVVIPPLPETITATPPPLTSVGED